MVRMGQMLWVKQGSKGDYKWALETIQSPACTGNPIVTPTLSGGIGGNPAM
jgi:hypothetical protein